MNSPFQEQLIESYRYKPFIEHRQVRIERADHSFINKKRLAIYKKKLIVIL